MYLRKVTLRNVKCFSELEIDFTTNERPRLWTAILGRNGLGKSTLLQAIGVALAGPWSVRELLPVAEGWVRADQQHGEIDAIIEWTEGDAQTPRWPKKTPYTARYIVTGRNPEELDIVTSERTLSLPPMSIVDWSGEGGPRERERIAKDMSRLKQTAYIEGKEGWLACGYGPFRRLSGGAQAADRILYSGRKSARFVTLFREDAALTDATDWLVSLYNKARDNDIASQSVLSQIKSAFANEFLPEPSELIINSHSALLRISNRTPVTFQDLSDGYRSMLALGIDLLRWIAAAFPDSSEDLLSHPGVVLIDELDAHAHPSWQREIGFWLRKKFPRIQFIIATHSPFLAQVSDEPGGYVVLEQFEGGVRIRDDVESVATWRSDQILTEIFDLPTTRSPDVERKLNRLQQLLQKGPFLTVEEQGEYRQLKLWSDSISPGVEDLADRRLAKVLQVTVDRLRDKIKEIK